MLFSFYIIQLSYSHIQIQIEANWHAGLFRDCNGVSNGRPLEAVSLPLHISNFSYESQFRKIKETYLRLQLLLKTRRLPTVTPEAQISSSSLLDPQLEQLVLPLLLELAVDML